MNKSKSRRAGIRSPTVDDPGAAAAPAASTRRSPVEVLDENQQFDVASKIHEILGSEFGAGGYIRLYRKKRLDAAFSSLTSKIPLEQFDQDWVLETYGGGEYMAKAYGSNHKLIRQLTWTVDSAIPSKDPAAAPAPGKSEGSLDLAEIMRAAKEGNGDGGASEGRLVELLMKQNAAQQAQILALLGTRSGGGDETLKTLLPFLLKDKQSTPIDDAMRLHQVIERAKKGESTDEPEEKSKIEQIIEKVLETVMPVIAEKFGGPGRAPATIPIDVSTRRVPVRVASAAPETQTTKEEDPMLKVIMGRFRSAVIKAAVEQKDAFQWVESMLEFIPTDNHLQVYQIANSDNWFVEMFGETNADAVKHKEFLEEVRNGILTIAFSNSTIDALQRKVDAPTWSKQFSDWACRTYREELADLAKQEDEFFPEIFAGVYSDNKVWFDSLREEIKKIGPAAP